MSTSTAQAVQPAEPRERALWVLERLSPGSAANHLSVTFTVAAPLRAQVLDRALIAVLGRHPALRTCYLSDGAELVKRVARPAELADSILVTELAVAPDADLDTVLRHWMRQPFELSGGLLLRAALIATGEHSVVCLVLHHLIFDTISTGPLVRDLAAFYEAFDTGADPDPQLLAEQPALAEPAATPAGLEHWLDQLTGYDPVGVRLACELPDPGSPSLSGEVVLQELPPEDREHLRVLQRRLRAPESTVLLSAFWLLLHGHGAGDDIVIGNPVSTRPADAPDAVGYHVNVLPLRIRLADGDTVASLTRRAREQFFEGMAHREVSVDELTPLIPRADSSWRSMLVNHVFNYVTDGALPRFRLAGAGAEPMHVENGCSKFDLELFVISTDDRLRLRLVYNTDILSRDDAVRLLQRYRTVLRAMADPDLPIAGLDVRSEEDHRVIDTANATERALPPQSLLAQLATQVRLRPDAVAVDGPDGPGSYARLWARSAELAGSFAAAGVRSGDVVGLCLPRGAELAAAVLGCWRIGARYLPIDPSLPAERIGYLIQDSGARVVLADQPDDRLAGHGATALVTGQAPGGADVDVEVLVESTAAYLIYTSGSTGQPKGTLIGERALRNLVEHFRSELGITAGDRMLWSTSFSFDISVLELLVPLVSGATVVPAPDAVRTDPEALRAALAGGVKYVQATPTTWRLVLDGVREALASVTVLVGGEPLPLTTARELAGAAAAVHHVYGPTETTVWSSSEVLEPDPAVVLVGRPIANTTFAVLAADGRELPVGARGELWIGGTGVADCYHGRPELTAERFTVRGGRRGYRTGDIARWTGDGRIELFGRSDRQVKIRGNRIELGEVETVLSRHPAVRSAAVVVVAEHTPQAQLVGFLETGADEQALDDIWEFAKQALPHGYLPQQLVGMPRLPVNMSNKIDYPGLAAEATALTERSAAAPAAPAATGGELTDELVRLWSELLETDSPVDENTHFFRTGGHSVLGALLMQRIKTGLGLSVPLAELFDAPTPAALAARIGELTAADEQPGEPA